MAISIKLMSNALDFISSAVEYAGQGTQRGLKYSVLHLSSGVELLLKERLKGEHWTLLFSDVDKAERVALEQGDFRSVDFISALKRLKDICQIDLNKHRALLETLRNFRNRLEHFEFKGTQEEVRSILVRAWSFVLDFIHDHLQTNISDENLETIRKIKEAMIENQDFVESREKEIKPQMEKIKRESYGVIISCPVCLQETLAITGEDPHCIFCRYSDDSNTVADRWCVTFVGYPYTDPKERYVDPVMFHCPECGSETFLRQEDGGMYPPDPAWFCFNCGYSKPYNEIKICSRCNEPFSPEDEENVCSDCWDDMMKSDKY
jgi:hypothetical protein